MSSENYIATQLTWENRNTNESLHHINTFLTNRNQKLRLSVEDIPLFQKCLTFNPDLFRDYKSYKAIYSDFIDYVDEDFFKLIPVLDKWYVYYLISRLTEVGQVIRYYIRLLILLDLDRDEEIGRKEKLLTEECFVDYPPIADFFRACAGEIVLRKELNEYFRPTFNKSGAFTSEIYVFREIPKAIIEYIDFNPLPQFNEYLLQLRDNFDSDISYITFLNYMGYNVSSFSNTDEEKESSSTTLVIMQKLDENGNKVWPKVTPYDSSIWETVNAKDLKYYSENTLRVADINLDGEFFIFDDIVNFVSNYKYGIGGYNLYETAFSMLKPEVRARLGEKEF